MINGYEYKGLLKGFFELPIDNNTTLSIYDSEEGYEIEFIENIDKIDENYIDCMIYESQDWETLDNLLKFTINNTYVKYYKNRLIEIIGGLNNE